MANGRGFGRKGDKARVSGGFVALPLSVLDSAAYAAASHTDRALLIEIARQCVGDNNGRLLASRAYLAGRGWKSAGEIHRSTQNLLALSLIHQTVQGHRPNRASWFAVTWRLLDPHPGYDPGTAATFERGSYLKAAPTPAARRQPPKRASKNAGLSPTVGTGEPSIGPATGQGPVPPVPMVGPIKAQQTTPPVPAIGHHLEKPSAVVVHGDADGQQGAEHIDDDGLETRERDGEIDASRFNPITGEFEPAPEPRQQLAKQAASAWVAAGLEQVKGRRCKGARQG